MGKAPNLPVVLRLAEAAARFLPQLLKRAIYRSPLLSSLIRDQLNSFAPSELTEVVVASGALRGARLKLDLKSEKYYWLGTYEAEMQRAVKELVQPGDIVYDVGANIGYFSLLFARLIGSGGMVFAFEPLSANIRRLLENISLNGLDHIITTVPCAVSDAEELAMFLVHSSDAMGKLTGSGGRNAVYENKIEVQCISLDSFVLEKGHPAPSVVKMDIEGSEVKAIPGMKKLLQQKRPKLLLEVHGPESGRVAWSVLTCNGYRIYRLQVGYPQITRLEDMEWKEYVLGRPM